MLLANKKEEYDCFSRVHFLAHFRFAEGLPLFSYFSLGVCLSTERNEGTCIKTSTRLSARVKIFVILISK